MFIKTGTKDKVRLISISRIVEEIKKKYELETTAEATDAIIGFHAFTGCDTVSAFWRKGKRRPWDLMMKDPTFVKLFCKLGINWCLDDDDTMSELEAFVCLIYGSKSYQSVDSLR